MFRQLSLGLDGEGCGAYCENFTYTRAFDLRDGRRLSLGDLLTPDGFADVGRRVDAARQGRFSLTVAGGTLAGTWADKDHGKELPAIVQ